MILGKRVQNVDCGDTRRAARWAAFFLLVFLVPGIAARSQVQRGLHRLWEDLASHRQPPDSTEFVFARVQFNSLSSWGFGYLQGWAHDYPDAEEHILQIANEATGINLNKMSYVIVRLDSEEIFRYPFLYFSEVGEMNLTEPEVANFREYLNRGGFAMIDDFDGLAQLDWFAAQMKRVFPNRNFVEMTLDHPVFHTFYEIPTLEVEPPYQTSAPPKFYGYFDEKGRLYMIINHNNDIGDFWEWIDQPMYPLEPSTEALRFGINYLIYSLTH
ncbi:MAG: DUF4159 domain-containing protein [Acidobacteria bacterium]|nr:DUF4159 domain-containing protein [Acidobacteriota bacterium]